MEKLNKCNVLTLQEIVGVYFGNQRKYRYTNYINNGDKLHSLQFILPNFINSKQMRSFLMVLGNELNARLFKSQLKQIAKPKECCNNMCHQLPFHLYVLQP